MGIAVGIGLMEFPFGTADGFWRWVDICEESTLDSIWQTDRLISPFPMLESMTALAAVAGRTRRLKFGVNVLSLAFRDPVVVAKQFATIDYLSNGRVLPAFGIGNPRGAEWSSMNRDTAGRGRRTDEALEIIARLWHEESIDFSGRFFELTGAGICPRPVQKRIPMWIGGHSPAAVRRTARYGTGWQAGLLTPQEVAPVIAAIRDAAAANGRTIDDDHYGAGFPFYFGSPDDPAPAAALSRHKERAGTDGREYLCIGDAATIMARLTAYIEAGASKFILRPVGLNEGEVIAQTERLIAEVMPRVDDMWGKKA